MLRRLRITNPFRKKKNVIILPVLFKTKESVELEYSVNFQGMGIKTPTPETEVSMVLFRVETIECIHESYEKNTVINTTSGASYTIVKPFNEVLGLMSLIDHNIYGIQ